MNDQTNEAAPAAAPARKFFDLNALAQRDTSAMPVRDPRTREPLFHGEDDPVEIDLYSLDSEIFRRRANARINRAMEEAAASRQIFKTAEDSRRESTETMVDAIAGWNIVVDGVTPDVKDPKAVARVLDDPRFGWLRIDIDNWLVNRANFIKGTQPK